MVAGSAAPETEVTMSEFDKLKDDAEQYAKDHPDQVRKAEQGAEHAVESRIGGKEQGAGEERDGEHGQDAQSGSGE